MLRRLVGRESRRGRKVGVMPKTIGEIQREQAMLATLRRIADALDAIAGTLAEAFRASAKRDEEEDEDGE